MTDNDNNSIVRVWPRRNGSWWPSQILGLDHLSTSHLTSPHSGTPVKLLRKEDSNKAESTQGMLLKKKEKYTGREDAILHALQLERQMLKKQEKIGDASD
ncbi:hypothetical protein JHK85_025725 [Glycine max]|nr:hypothetical protein JHK85_025725 [Glycine max]KAG5012964.1 hypothetical protein JHK86_025225 [Glycine max]